MKKSLFVSILILPALLLIQWKSIESENLVSKFEPFDNLYFQRSFPDHQLDLVEFDRVMGKARKQMTDHAEKSIDGVWTSHGPNNIGGRFNCLASNPENPQEILAGAAAGGIFKTIDGGANWYPVADDFSYLAIGCIVYDPTNNDILYAGSGDPNISGLPHIGNGVYKSTDGGESWIHMGLTEQRIVSKIVVNPENNQQVFAGTMGVPFERNTDRGLYKSEDGGGTWEQVLYINDECGVIDLLMNPDEPETLYAAVWNRIRNNHESLISGNDARIWRTQDSGDNWEMLTNGLPQDTLSRIGLAMSGSDPNKLFALVIGTDFQIEGVYRTVDGGDNWGPFPWDIEQMSGMMGGFGWYFGQIRVNPWNDDELSILGVDLFSTTNGGMDWMMTTPAWWVYEVHADKHDLLYLDETTSILATDGGIYKSDNSMSSWEDIEDIAVTQFYRVAINPHNPGVYTGGAQDNGTTTGSMLAPNEWERDYGGDGFQAVYDPFDPNLRYAETQNGNRVYNDGDQWSGFNDGVDDNDRSNWDTPLIMSAADNELMYTASYRVYKNTSSPYGFWEAISGDLTDGVIFGDNFHTVTTLAESAMDPAILYAGTTDGNVWHSLDAGDNWENITGLLPERYVTSVKASPLSASVVYVTHSGYKDNDQVSYVHKSLDYGNTWQSISGDLPDLPINHIEVYNDSTFVVATDAGVYFSDNEGQNWERVGENMPLIPVFDIELDLEESVLVAGTFARSLMTFPLDSLIQEEVIIVGVDNVDVELKVFPNPCLDNLQIEGILPGTLVSLFSISGVLVAQEIVRTSGIDVEFLPAGLYFISIANQRVSEPFIKL